MVSRFQSNPKQLHLNAINQILTYIQVTLDFGLWYPHNDDFTLFGYTNADWGGSNDKKSTSVVAFFLVDRLVSWHSKNQECVILSTCRSEYVATTACCT